MKIIKQLSTLILLVAISVATVWGQNQMSPYSKYGYGMLNDYAMGAQRAMGGVGIAQNHSRQINAMNPASYAAMDSLTFLFDFGLSMVNLKATETTSSGTKNKANGTGGGLDYIAMQFPIVNKYLAGSIGLVPYTSVGYSFGSKLQHGTSTYEGYGGFNEIYLGLGARPFKNFYIGFNIGYMWGLQVNDIYAVSDISTTSLMEDYMRVRDWHLNVGVQYDININRKNKLTLGVTWQPGKKMHGTVWAIKYDVNQDTKPDTTFYGKINHSINYKGNNIDLKYSVPHIFNFGLAYKYDDHLTAEIDYQFAKLSKADFTSVDFQDNNSYFTDRQKIAFGASYRINPRGNWIKRVHWRIGTHYTKDYLQLDGNRLREYGLSFGFGLPLPATKTIINLGFQWINRTTQPVEKVKENYFNITLGINFNEMWFWKNKIQ